MRDGASLSESLPPMMLTRMRKTVDTRVADRLNDSCSGIDMPYEVARNRVR